MSGYGLFARYYDELTRDVDYPGMARHIDRLFRKHTGIQPETVLDLACGTGSLSMELAARGYDVIGTDASEQMLAVALQKVNHTPHPILFLQQRMQDLDLYGTVQACVCMLDSLNHLPDERAFSRVLGRVSLFLEPQGVFVFDLNTLYKHRKLLDGSTFVYELDKVYCVWQNTCRCRGNIVCADLDFFEALEDGKYCRAVEQVTERIFSHRTVCRMLRYHGFRLEAVYNGYTMAGRKPDSARLVYVAVKQKTEQDTDALV